MLVENQPRKVILELAAKVQDESLPITERRDALKLICQLRHEQYQHVSDENLSPVVAGMVCWPEGIKGLSLVDAAQAVAQGNAQRNEVQRKAW